jgi:hypothetical protein
MRELLLARARGEHEKSGVIKSLQRAAINTQNPNVKFGRQARESMGQNCGVRVESRPAAAPSH